MRRVRCGSEWRMEPFSPACPHGALSLGQDRDGNLWMGTDDIGAFKLAAGGILTYSTEDGIEVDSVISVAQTLRGELYIGCRTESGGVRIGFRSGNGFHAIVPRV